MKIFLAVAFTFAIAVAETIPGQGGYSGGGSGGAPFSAGGGGFNFGSGGYTTGGNIGGFSSAAGPSPSYSAPDAVGGYSGPGGNADGQGSDAAQGPQVFKYISVHAAPEDPEDQATKTVKVPGGNNKHVNIIFVKAPSNGADQKTEVVLPEADEHKNLVYVLVQKTDPTANLQIRRPQPTKPAKPEVYFIRYKNPAQADQSSDAGAAGGYSNGAAGGTPAALPSSAYGAPSPSYGSPSPAYGAP